MTNIKVDLAANKAEDARDYIYLLGPRHTDCLDDYKEELPPWRLKDRVSY